MPKKNQEKAVIKLQNTFQSNEAIEEVERRYVEKYLPSIKLLQINFWIRILQQFKVLYEEFSKSTEKNEIW